LNDQVKTNFGKIPKDIDLIIGIPRSGILPATLLALYCHKPFMSLNEFLGGLSPLGGERTKDSFQLNKGTINVLVVDDSINSGNALNISKQKLAEVKGEFNFIFCCIYSTDEAKDKVDIFFEIIENPRIFEWNLTRSWVYSNSCVDIDGVLCVDPTEEQNDDGEKYREFILNAVPKYLPKVKIKYLVTSRLEKYRYETEKWLKMQNIEYQELFMLDLPNKEIRQKLNCHGKFKAEVYLKKRYSSILFIESSRHQSIEINKLTKLPVFCTDTMEFFDQYKEVDILRYKVKGILSQIKRSLFK
jgi:uncharacterized HAD superfamily protein